MAAYLIRVTDNKRGVIYSPIIGPFLDDAAAQAFSDEHEMDEVSDWEGGYAACHVISDGTAQSPEAYHEEWMDVRSS